MSVEPGEFFAKLEKEFSGVSETGLNVHSLTNPKVSNPFQAKLMEEIGMVWFDTAEVNEIPVTFSWSSKSDQNHMNISTGSNPTFMAQIDREIAAELIKYLTEYVERGDK